MIKTVRYEFPDYSIEKKDLDLRLIINSENFNPEQRNLFSVMLNFGYIEFIPGIFSLTADDIYDFWNYVKNSALKINSIDKYYELLNLEEIYKERIPSIKTEGAFHSNDFKMKVVWIKTDTNMFSAPIAFNQEGLKLFDFEYGDVIGTLYPEYYHFYRMIDEANSNWSSFGAKKKYEFLEDVNTLSKKRDIILPTNLKELMNKNV